MAAEALTQLAQGLKQAPQPLLLSAAFMGAHGARAPPGLDGTLAAAFRLPAQPAGVRVEFSASNVGPIVGDRFEVSDARLSFLGYDAAKSNVTLRFTQTGDVVDVLIAVALSDWSWTTPFPQTIGWPFDELDYAQPGFVFTTASADYGGQTFAPGQSFAAQALAPRSFEALLELVGLSRPASALPIIGPVVLDRVQTAVEPAILYPDLDLAARLAKTSFKIFFLEVSEPAIGLLVETVEEAEQLDDATVTVYEQTPSLWFGAALKLPQTTLDVRAQLLGDGVFGFGVMVEPRSERRLTPAAAIELVAGPSGASFLAGVPAPLQQFLESVGLDGMGLSGMLDPPTLLSSSAHLASAPGKPLVLFGDPTSGQDFQIDGFFLDWIVSSPLEPKTSSSYVKLGATFHLWQRVFDGPFEVTIDSNLRIEGRFDGTVELRRVVEAVTRNAVALPSGVEASISDVGLVIDPPAHSYELTLSLDVTLDFLKVAGKPLLAIDDLTISLAATTPPAGAGESSYAAALDGTLAVGPLAVYVAATYERSGGESEWSLHAQLVEELRLFQLVGQFFRDYELPRELLPGELAVTAFALDARLPAAADAASYAVSGTLVWKLPFGLDAEIAAQLELAYDATRAQDERFSGAVIGTLTLAAPALTVQVGYRFGPTAQDPRALPGAGGEVLARDGRAAPQDAGALPVTGGDSTTLWVAWAGIRGEWESRSGLVTISLAGWTVGGLIEALVRTLGDPYFTLPAPWDLLDKIPLDGLKLVIDTRREARRRVWATYTLSSPIELGFLTIRGLVFTRGEDGKVMLAIDGSATIGGLEDEPLFKPEQGGQDVRDLPSPAGQGTSSFKLWLLALGQRVAIRDAPSFRNTQDVIRALEGVPASGGARNPVDPGATTSGQPYYEPASGWLVAAHFGLLQVGRVWTFELMVVFADPDLYGLHLAFNGEKAKVLDGLSLDVLYKKVSDDVGVYELEFSFPKSLRTFDLGMFTVTLPSIGIQIYTNGDFLFDLGFPYNLDFSRSFTMQAIIYGVPVIGSLGFYFGRLPAGAVPQLPRKYEGSFGTVTVFGLGLQVGVGRYYERGPLKAGFSITVFGIVEGAIAPWHASEADARPVGGALQGDYWFWLQGTFGILGRLYGSVDFAIIKADVQLTVELVAKVSYEAFKNIELSATASVHIAITLKIDCGIFTIKLHFTFAATITADLTIQTHGTPPWAPHELPASLPRGLAIAPPPAPRFKPVVPPQNPPAITLTPAPQFTVLGPPAGPLAAQQGAFVFLLALDAPAAEREGNRDGSSFTSLCEALLPWVINAYVDQTGTEVDLARFAAETSVSRAQLESFVTALGDGAPIMEPDVEAMLLARAFTVNVEAPKSGREQELEGGASVFPPFAGLSLTFPDPAGATGTKTIALADYVTIDDAYRVALAERFAKLAAQVEAESRRPTPAAADSAPEPLARFVFEDWFALVARELLQGAADALGDYAYAVRAGDSLGGIRAWANERGNAVSPLDIAAPNLTHPLRAGKQLVVGGLAHTVQSGESAASIAAAYSDRATPPRWRTTPESVILANGGVHGLLAPDATIRVSGHAPYTTRAGESFDDVAAALGVSLEALAGEAAVQGDTTLLAPSLSMAVPAIDYTTAGDGGDTLAAILARFGVPLATLVEDTQNQQVADLFAEGTLAIAALERLFVADLWDALQRRDRIAQVAGMVARFSLHGLRLPLAPGLTLPADFLYPPGQADYGLYQLTGQQLPTPTLSTAPSYELSVSKDPSLAWLAFDGSPSTASLALRLDEQARQLHYLLTYAREAGYDPAPTLAALPAASTAPKRYAVQGFVRWTTSDLASVLALTSGPEADAGPAPQPQPILWNLPPSLLGRVEALQAGLERRFETAALLPHLPLLAPEVGSADPASGHTTFAPVEAFALATRIQIEVRRLAQDDARAPQRPDANDVIPPGIGNAGAPPPLAPYTYELVGPSPADALLLERLLTAMHSLGEQIVSGLFLLYQEGGEAATSLTSRGAGEFLAFLTQTNLSTETHPPTAARAAAAPPGPPRGIANSPAEFVKLLWECATVRSGGYYLTYQLPDAGAGLPASLFDANGTATLTLAIAYDRATLGRLTSFVNAVLTTAAIDTDRAAMTLASRPAPTSAAPLAGGESLADLTALYGTDAGLLAALNGEQALATGARIPIAGVVHQVTARDLAGGDALAAVAAHYSVGAAEPLTRAALQTFNPGVEARLGTALRIPPLTCVIAASGGAGNSFEALGAFYGLTPDALGAAARDVPGLFDAGATPTVDSEQRDLVAGLGTGNAGVELTRTNLGGPPDLPKQREPTPAELAAFGEGYLFSLYTLLEGSLAANAFFRESPPGMPFGPRHRVGPEEAHALRDPARRRAALRAAAEEPFAYEQAVGFGAFADVNAAPEPAAAQLPPRSASPYAGIGTLLQLDLRWLDVFGNLTPTPWSAPLASTGPLNELPIPLGYADRLVGLGQWPNAHVTYEYRAPDDAPELTIAFALKVAAYEADARAPLAPTGIPDWQQRAIDDLRTYTRVYFQLNQDYDAAGVPGLAGQAVAMSLRHTLLAAPRVALSDAQAQQVRDFVAGCVVYLARRAIGEVGGDVPRAVLALPIDVSALASADVFPLRLAFTLTRQAALSDPALRALADGCCDTTPILPASGGEEADSQVSLRAFAEAFEAAFDTADWRLRLGATAGESENDASALWVVRFAKTPGSGLGYAIGQQPSFFAPKPLATTLRSASAEVKTYESGRAFPAGSETLQFTGVDLNAWALSAFQAIDAFLSAPYAVPAYVLDCLLTPEQPEQKGLLAKVLAHKQKLAAAVARTVTPILADSANDPLTHEAAEEKLRQALLDELGAAFSVTAVTVFPVTDAKAREPLAPGVLAPPRFYGQPLGTLAPTGEGDGDAAGQQNFSLSSAKVPLTPAGGDGVSRLAFLFESKDVAAAPYVTLDLEFALTHLEHDMRGVPGIDGYEQSEWIGFLTGPCTAPIATGVALPIALRALPRPPTVTGQTASAATRANGTTPAPAELAGWDYAFSYLYAGAAQDTVSATVRVNVPPAVAAPGDSAEEQLFRALAQFTAVQPAIAADLDGALRPIDGTTRPTDPAVAIAHDALVAFEAIVDELATAYDRWSRPEPQPAIAAAAGAGPPPIVQTLELELSADAAEGGRARVDIVAEGGEALPPPTVLIDPEHCLAEPIPPRTGASVAYAYRLRDGSGWLDYAQARAIPARTIAYDGLDVVTAQNAAASLHVVRNEQLVPGEATAPAFVFSTPEVAFAEPVVPLLAYAAYDLGAVRPGPASLASYLEAFFASLLGPTAGATVAVKLTACYAHRLIPSATELPATVLAIALLPPTPAAAGLAATPPFVAALAARVEAWLRAHRPPGETGAWLTFALELLGDPAAPQTLPLLRIEDLHIATADLTPAR